MRRSLFLALILMAAVGPPSGAVTLLVNGDTPSVRWQGAIERASVPLPDGAIDLHLDACPFTTREGVPDGCVPENSNPPAIYVAPRDPATMRRTLLHEVGHVFDAQKMTPGARARFLRIWRRSANVSWCEDAEPYDPGAFLGGSGGIASRACEWFADAYSVCGLAGGADYWHMALYVDQLIYIPNGPRQNSTGDIQLRRRLVATCQLIAHLGE